MLVEIITGGDLGQGRKKAIRSFYYNTYGYPGRWSVDFCQHGGVSGKPNGENQGNCCFFTVCEGIVYVRNGAEAT